MKAVEYVRGWRPGAIVRWSRRSTRNLAVVVVVIILLASVIGLGVSSWSTSNFRDLQHIGFDVDRVMAIETQLTSWPTRHTGTIYELKAAEYVASEFIAAGLKNVQIESFPEVEYEVMGASLQLVYYTNGPFGAFPQPNRDPITFQHKVDFVVQGYSGSHDQGSGTTAFRNDMEYVGLPDNGSDESHYSPAIGSVAIIPTAPGVSNYRIFDIAYDAGVTGLILHNVDINERVDYVPISKGSRQPEGWPDPDYPDIPFLMVSKAAGDQILAAQNAKLRLHVDVDIGMRDVHAVVGEVPGQGDTDEFVVIGAHHDSVYISKGAIDNGCGTTTVIELAHQLADAKVERTIRLVTYGGEEDGLYGSFAYVEAHEDEMARNCIAVLNFDMPHVNLQRGNRGTVMPDQKDRFGVLEAIIDQIYEDRPDMEDRFDYQVAWMEDPSVVGSDSMPYAQLGIETVNFWGSGAWEYHTYLEDITHFMPEGLEMAVLIGGSYAMWLAENA
ncbi:MAG: M28 family peptidase [Thermoplasmata archaeon]|nr:M28 family peptidase [Thermoplasmata archaeon]